MNKELTEREIDYIRKFFYYDKESGEIVRTDRKNSTGSIDKDGYRIIKIKGKQYKYHRIVYFLCHGCMPSGEIDHINHNRTDNRIENLRDVTHSENLSNMRKRINKDTGEWNIQIDRTPGLKAIYSVRKEGKQYRFRTIEEAIRKRDELYGI